MPRAPTFRKPPAVSIPSSSGHQFTAELDLEIQTYLLRGVSIPSSSGHQFTGQRWFVHKGCAMGVSIPSSSGHQFTARSTTCRAIPSGCPCFNPFFIRASVYCSHQVFQARLLYQKSFQSLLHQGISLLRRPTRGRQSNARLFQSLLHQGISLLQGEDRSDHCRPDGVSIPSSSGHQFTACGWWRRASPRRSRFNPFFIRASVYCHAYVTRYKPHPRAMFQSLLHQGISLLREAARKHGISHETVSIPSSSGHQFTGGCRCLVLGGAIAVSIPSSSGHQFTASNCFPLWESRLPSFNPFFIRASVYCNAPPSPTPSCAAPVSIPSSSGHQFTAE